MDTRSAIKTIKEEKAQLEEDLYQRIMVFQALTGAMVTDLSFPTIKSVEFGNKKPMFIQGEVQVKLEIL